jgi:glutamine amidotransferase
MIAIIKYNAGNIGSVQNALQRLGYNSIVTDNVDEIINADKVIFPGVGEASTAMQYLKEKELDQVIKNLTQPVLGICLGLQLMCQHTEEGDVDCLGIFNAQVKEFPNIDIVPHMGWNNLSSLSGPLYKDITNEDNFYFVHSFYAGVSTHTSSICDYILPFSAGLEYKNYFATQFHPEKSANIGSKFLQNFLSI